MSCEHVSKLSLWLCQCAHLRAAADSFWDCLIIYTHTFLSFPVIGWDWALKERKIDYECFIIKTGHFSIVFSKILKLVLENCISAIFSSYKTILEKTCFSSVCPCEHNMSHCRFKISVYVFRQSVNFILLGAYSEDHLLSSVNVYLSIWNNCIKKIE